jgi:hypothetical protein
MVGVGGLSSLVEQMSCQCHHYQFVVLLPWSWDNWRRYEDEVMKFDFTAMVKSV